MTYSDEFDPDEFGLVVPFVTVTSVGGPHEDDAYACGWEMGALDVALARAEDREIHRVIHTDNAAQADLVAMRHGYGARIERIDDTWSRLVLTRVEVII